MEGHDLDIEASRSELHPLPKDMSHGSKDAKPLYQKTAFPQTVEGSHIIPVVSMDVVLNPERYGLQFTKVHGASGSSLQVLEPDKDRRQAVRVRKLPRASEKAVEISTFDESSTDSAASIDEEKRNYLQPKGFQRKLSPYNWRRRLKHISLFFALCLAIWFFVPFPFLVSPSDSKFLYFYPTPWACSTNGFAVGGPWNLIGIDIRFGRMTFGQAKGLDLAWNWVAGRGLQFLLAWVSYRVFTDALMRTAEITYVPYELFTSLALFSTKTDALWYLTRGVLTLPGLRIKFIIGWLLFSTAYLAMFPSLMDVISGYEAAYDTVLVLPNRTTLKLDGLESFDGPLYRTICYGENQDPSTCEPYHYQFYDPILNDSYKAIAEWELGISDIIQPRPLFYAELPQNFNCVAEQNIYQWGFSAEWVLIAGCLNSVWMLGLWILWLDADRKSEFCKMGRRMGVYRAIVDIAEAIREDLGPHLSAYSEEELAAAIRKQGKLKYYVSGPKGGSTRHIGLSSRQSGKLRLRWDKKYR